MGKSRRSELSSSDIRHIFEHNFRDCIKDVVYRVALIGPVSRSGIDLSFLVALSSDDPTVSNLTVTLPYTLCRLIRPGMLIKNKRLLTTKRDKNDLTLRLVIKPFSLRRVEGKVISSYLAAHFGHLFEVRNYPLFSWTAHLDVRNGQGIVEEKEYTFFLPVSEMIKFYFFPSTRLQSVAFMQDPLDNTDNKLYVPSSLTTDGSNPKTIIIRDDMLVGDVATIARIAYSPLAAQGFSAINASLMRGIHEKYFYFDSNFPFEEETALTFTGVVLDANSGIFLVNEILTCTGPFPFDRLRYDKETSLRKEKDDKKEKTHLEYVTTDQNAIDKILNQRAFSLFKAEFTNRLPTVNNNLKTNRLTFPVKVITPASGFLSLTDDIEIMTRERRKSLPVKKRPVIVKIINPTLTSNNEKTNKGGGFGLETVSGPAFILQGDMIKFMELLRQELKNESEVKFFSPNGIPFVVDQNLQLYFTSNDTSDLFAFNEFGAPRMVICIAMRLKDFYFVVMEFEPKKQQTSRLRGFYKMAGNDQKFGDEITYHDLVDILTLVAKDGSIAKEDTQDAASKNQKSDASPIDSHRFEMVWFNHTTEETGVPDLPYKALNVASRKELIIKKLNLAIDSYSSV